MKTYGITIAEGANITNLAVATGTSFPSNPDEGELFFRTDSAITTKGLYCYIAGSWDRLASSESITAPTGASLPGTANTGDLFYKNSNDGQEGLYAYDDTAWVPVASGSTPSYTITGDVTGTIDGGTDVLTLATVNSNVGSFGAADKTLTFTVNGKGLTTAASAADIAIATSQVTSGTFADARISQSSVTQHQGSLVLSTSQVTSGTFADARISQSSVTQHQAALTITESQITDGSLLARLGATETVSGSWTFSNPIIGATPTVASHLTTKQYVDSALTGLSWKTPARVATTSNITLSGTQTIDGQSLSIGDRVLVKNQSTAADNGVYVVASGTWTRADDFDTTSPIDEVNSAAIFIKSGAVNADTGWTQTAEVSTIGTDAMTFVQFSAAGAYSAGAGLTLTGTVFDVGTASSARIVVNPDNIDLATIGTPVSASFVKPTTDAYGRVTATTAVVTGDITALLSYAGDVSSSGTTTTLATVNSNVGSFGSSTSIPSFTVNGKGLITAASGNVVVAPAGTLTGATLASGVTASSLTSVGTLTSMTTSGNAEAAAFIPSGSTAPSNGVYLPSSNSVGISTNSTLRLQITSTGVIQDAAGLELGWKTCPQNSQSAAYTLVLADGGKHIFHPSADTTARTYTIPANSSVAYPIGTAVTFINQNSAGVITIAITTDTMRLAGAGTTGSRTLAANGIATAFKVTSTEWIISGTGLT